MKINDITAVQAGTIKSRGQLSKIEFYLRNISYPENKESSQYLSKEI
jgi:hypothetical protein